MSSSDSLRSAAEAASSICPGEVAPTTGAVTFVRDQAMATYVMETSSLSAT